jgi:DNA helicase-4
VLAIIRKRLKAKSKELEELISNASDSPFIDIPTYIKKNFYGKTLSETEQKEIANHYSSYFHETCSLVKKLNFFGITPSETIAKFILDFGNISKLVKQHNEEVMNLLLDTHKSFFDHCLKYPLDKQQRRSIVSEENNCLVVSSAGSGKTSSIVGKVKYLTEIKGIAPERILLISYTNKAASELTERMNTKGLRGYTFHKLAIDIIAQTTGTKPSICDNTDALFVGIYRKLLEKASFKRSIIQYFIDYQTNEADW